MERVLVVDDDPLIANVVALTLREQSYEVLIARTGREALEAARDHNPDLVILDIGLPDIGGVEVCREIRRHSAAPVLFLTVLREEADKAAALGAGGDDYLTKPVGTLELADRVRTLLQRGDAAAVGATAGRDIYSVGDVHLDVSSRRVTVAGRDVELTPRELKLLGALMERPGQVLERKSLVERVWGSGWPADDNVLDIFIRGLQAKIEPDQDRPVYVESVAGVGYRFREK